MSDVTQFVAQQGMRVTISVVNNASSIQGGMTALKEERADGATEPEGEIFHLQFQDTRKTLC